VEKRLKSLETRAGFLIGPGLPLWGMASKATNANVAAAIRYGFISMGEPPKASRGFHQKSAISTTTSSLQPKRAGSAFNGALDPVDARKQNITAVGVEVLSRMLRSASTK
jgi:hypothetical protein